ncbi:hypothetical protein GCM10020256_13350 [Streptomyces thermocoprophilus]
MLVAVALVVAAVFVGRHIQDTRHSLFVDWPPLVGTWEPHLGPGTPFAAAVAVAVVAYGPRVAARLRWRALLLAAYGTALAWTWSLALIDGWQRGVVERLTTRHEYVPVVGRFHDIPAALRDFTNHILIHSPDNWPAHVAGHPPGAVLTFVLLDRAGLGGGGWAGAWCITVGATGCVAVLVAVRALASERLARRAAPFLVLAPAAVWAGASPDAYFAAVVAWSVALLALAVSGGARWWALGSGLLFGLTCYLSYGLTLFALPLAAVLLLGRGRPRVLPFAVAGLAVVPAAFTLAGFDWWEAYRLLVRRYYEGAGGIRPYGYWVWANLACTVLLIGLASAAGLRRAGGRAGVRPAPARGRGRRTVRGPYSGCRTAGGGRRPGRRAGDARGAAGGAGGRRAAGAAGGRPVRDEQGGDRADLAAVRAVAAAGVRVPRRHARVARRPGGARTARQPSAADRLVTDRPVEAGGDPDTGRS